MMPKNAVIVAGGGIGGLAAALTLHQIGVPCVVYEAVRELYDLGISQDDLDRIGLPAREWALVGLNGNDIYSEVRGRDAGYHWPQYAVHRGQLHMLLYNTLIARIGRDAVKLGCRVTGFAKDAGGVTAFIEHADGAKSEAKGALLIGADGIHSAISAQMHPTQPPIHWGGAIMWRGTTWAKPIRSGASFVGLGTHRQRMVFYPISQPDPKTGLSMINWIAEVTQDNSEGWKQRGWFREVPVADFVHHFDNWIWDWFDVPAFIKQADTAFENPMIDRDPVATWCDGPAALMGDAAHAMYPTGSNGGSQAIVDARELGAAMIAHGVTPAALAAYNDKLCGPISQLILRNRGAGPFGLLNMVDERCGGTFDNIDDVIPPKERTEFMAGYKAAAGFAIEKLNNAPRTIKDGAKV
jgi:2-polyprenyl-6-methoxyphenol hydroxylase-like FAD-dependent oxidoreductase